MTSRHPFIHAAFAAALCLSVPFNAVANDQPNPSAGIGTEQGQAEIASPGFTIHSGARDRYDATLLSRLFYLKADPGIFERMPQIFLGLLPIDRIFDYADRDSYVFKDVVRKPDELRFTVDQIAIAKPWKGGNEFEVQDTIARFIATERAYFEGLLPEQVIVDHYQPAAVDRYVDGGFNLEISGWDNGGLGSTEYIRTWLDVPVTFPQRWEMSEDEARSMLENQLADSRSIYIRTRYRIGEPELASGGVFAATEAVSIDIIKRTGRQEKIGTLPIIPVFDPAQLASRLEGEGSPWPLDPETVRILAAAKMPALLDDDRFMRDTYQARAMMQTALNRGHYSGRFADPDAMSSAMLANSDHPSAAQLVRYRDYVQSSIANMPTEIEFPYLPCITVVASSGKDDGCYIRQEAEGDVLYLELNSQLRELEEAGRSGITNADDLYEITKPEALKLGSHILYEAGRNLPVFVAFVDHPGLYHQAPEGIRNDAQGVTLRARIAEVKVVAEPALHVHVVLEPAALDVSYPGLQETIDLSVTLAAPSTGFDVVGVSVGTRMPEAPGILAAAGYEPSFMNWEIENPIYAHAISMKKVTESDGVKIVETMALISDDAGPDGVVRGIGRSIDLEGSKETLWPALGQQLRDSLVSKYGEPALLDDDEMAWASDPAMQARLRSGSRNLFKSCTDGSNGTRESMTAADDIAAYQIVMRIAKDAFIEESCGQVLYARYWDGGMQIVLSDSDFILEETTRRQALAEQEAKQEEQALPKFDN